MPTQKITLSLTNSDIVQLDDVIARGEYASRSEYVRQLIKEDRARKSEIAYIRAVLDKAEKSGLSEGTPDEIFDRVKSRALAKLKSHV